MTATNSKSHGRARAGAILIYVLTVLLTGSAIVKFAHVPQPTAQLAELGFDGAKLTLIATLELGSAILFVYPKTRFFGLLMLSAYLGGAVSAHVAHDQLPYRPAIVLALVWLAVWLRRSAAYRTSSLADVTSHSEPGPVPNALSGGRA